MPEWYEVGYPGGKMVAVLGFPRPLYPPGAKGHKASVDGSDVEAYKRTVSRAGRWEWQAFDQAFSKAFSRGKSGNVGESGVAGVQRQGDIEDTGFVGEETFNLLRSIRIPDGLPHAGETAMDARSVELINAAWDRFGGDPDAGGGGGGDAAGARLSRAVSQLGQKENPSGSNLSKYGDWYGMNGQPWCAMFVTWCDQTGAQPTPSFTRAQRYSYCPYIVNDARLGKYGLSLTSSPKPGDIVLYDWSRDGEYDHVGLFEEGTPASFNAIEGNTSTSNNSNGGQVMRRVRSASGQGTLFVRVREP